MIMHTCVTLAGVGFVWCVASHDAQRHYECKGVAQCATWNRVEVGRWSGAVEVDQKNCILAWEMSLQ